LVIEKQYTMMHGQKNIKFQISH